MYYSVRFLGIFLLFLGILSFPFTAKTDMSGGDFEIYADSFSTIDDTVAANGGIYKLFGTAGEGGATNASGGAYALRGGFQAMELGAVSLDLSLAAVNFGEIVIDEISSSSITATISADSGYYLTAVEDGNLRNGANDIDDVVAGAVVAGTEAYGVRTSGVDGAQNDADVALSGVALTLATNAGLVSGTTTTINFLLAVGNDTLAGDYSHTVTLSVISRL